MDDRETRPTQDDSPESVSRDIAAVNRVASLPGMLENLCRNTGLGFAAVARVTEATWVACAVRDAAGFGMLPGAALDASTTLCSEVRASKIPIAFDRASVHPKYCRHPAPKAYGIESYISVPILLPGGEYFGNLVAMDREPRRVDDPLVLAASKAYAQLIGGELERQRREDENEAALGAERTTSRLREEFIAVLGHDLRNPLSAVMATAELLVQRGAAVDAEGAGRRIRASARRMSRLIDDVMDFARGRLGAGLGMRIAREDDLAGALNEVVAEARASHPRRRVESRFDIPCSVDCDRSRMQQLLSNLLGNALGHGSPDSAILAEASVEGGSLILSVLNEGPGIDPEHLARVFEPYWRPPTSRSGGGLGLGLHICSQIAAGHSGRMHADSSALGPTRFSALIPLETAGASGV